MTSNDPFDQSSMLIREVQKPFSLVIQGKQFFQAKKLECTWIYPDIKWHESDFQWIFTNWYRKPEVIMKQ